MLYPLSYEGGRLTGYRPAEPVPEVGGAVDRSARRKAWDGYSGPRLAWPLPSIW
jgi:hypothetical protein